VKSKKNRQITDCVTLKRRAQEKIFAETKAMSPAEQIKYFRKRAQTGPLGSWWKKVTGTSSAQATALAVRERSGRYRTR
jgi:hypothetical protein